MNVAKITAEKAVELNGQEYMEDSLYSPVQDKNGNWIVSLIEAQYLSLSDFQVIEHDKTNDETEIFN